jgi:hypothetical protein
MTDYETAFRNLTDKWHESVKHYEARIEKLEAALREIASVSKVYVANGDDMAQALTTLLWSHRKIAIAALEGKDD